LLSIHYVYFVLVSHCYIIVSYDLCCCLSRRNTPCVRLHLMSWTGGRNKHV